MARFLDPTALVGLESRTLFYPSAGSDWSCPIVAFSPWIEDFWFVDINNRLDPRVPSARMLEEIGEERLEGRSLRSGEPFSVLVRHKLYRQASGRTLTIHACTGRGYDALRSTFGKTGRKLSIFFHRGDSPGEGGSNFYWLGRKRIKDVLSYLEPGGLIVSDGSLAIRPLRRRFQMTDPAEIVRAATSFEAAGYRFVCVGYLGERYGPTLVWKTFAQA